jgi:hypothetical protein
MNLTELLQYHVTGAIERGEGEAIVEIPALYRATCVADLENFILKLPAIPDISKPVAQWSRGQDIYIRGIWKGRGNSCFGPAYAIRWECKEMTGMFGKGLAGYMRDLPKWAAQLPKSK